MPKTYQHPAPETIKLNLRIPKPLHVLLTKFARGHNRSLNAEILTAIEVYFDTLVAAADARKPK